MNDYKNIHIGNLISQKVNELELDNQRIANFFKCSHQDIKEMYSAECLDTGLLLKWSKLLEYDFFRLYTHHLILFSPPSGSAKKVSLKTSLPQFRKNIYTKDLINFILELIKDKQKTKQQVIEEYKIPKTTLYKWIDKNKNI